MQFRTFQVSLSWSFKFEIGWKPCACLVSQLCLTLCNPKDCSPPGSPVQGTLRQEYWNGFLCPPPGGLPNQGIKPRPPTLQADSSPSESSGKPKNTGLVTYPSSSRGSSQPRKWTRVSYVAGRFFTNWATREDLKNHVGVKQRNLACWEKNEQMPSQK